MPTLSEGAPAKRVLGEEQPRQDCVGYRYQGSWAFPF